MIQQNNFRIATAVFAFYFSTITMGQESVQTATTEGQLTVTVTTSKTSTPTYSPRHILAIYILDSQGKFVKTLLAYASERRQYLINWRNVTTVAGSAYNTVDAITGATQLSHDSRTCTWNSKNRLGAIVEDGSYTLRMELTDNDGLAQNIASFNFTKGSTAQTITPSTMAGFSNITIQWQPASTSIEVPSNESVVSLFPNPVNKTLSVIAIGMTEMEIFDLNGKLLLTGKSPVINVGNLPSGEYIVVITLNKQRYSKRFIKL